MNICRSHTEPINLAGAVSVFSLVVIPVACVAMFGSRWLNIRAHFIFALVVSVISILTLPAMLVGHIRSRYILLTIYTQVSDKCKKE